MRETLQNKPFPARRANHVRKVRAAFVVIDERTAAVELHPLPRGLTCLFSPEDLDLVTGHEWTFTRARPGEKPYAVTIIRAGGISYSVRMNRFLLGVEDPEILVDHRNGDTLDNRRENLRRATRTQNSGNRRVIESRLGFKGVYQSSAQRFGAKLGSMRLGTFSTPEEAAAAYDAAAIAKFGEFAATNADLRGGAA